MWIRVILHDEGEVIETPISNWRNALKCARYNAQGRLLFKHADVINSIGYNGIYRDTQITAMKYDKEGDHE